MANSLQALLNIQQPALELARLRGTRESELRRRVEAGNPEAVAPLTGLQEEIAADPYTGIVPQTIQAEREGRQRKLQDFFTPQETAVREAEESSALRKLLFPEIVRGQFGTEQQQIASEGSVRAAEAGLGRSLAVQEAIGKRAAETGQRTSQRQAVVEQIKDRLMQARAIEAQAGKRPFGLFTGNLTERAKALRAEAAALAAQIGVSPEEVEGADGLGTSNGVIVTQVE